MQSGKKQRKEENVAYGLTTETSQQCRGHSRSKYYEVSRANITEGDRVVENGKPTLAVGKGGGEWKGAMEDGAHGRAGRGGCREKGREGRQEGGREEKIEPRVSSPYSEVPSSRRKLYY